MSRAAKSKAAPKPEKVKRAPTPAQMSRIAIRERVKVESGGKCSRCGANGDCVVPTRTAFELLCRKCNGARGGERRVAKKALAAKQAKLFPESP